MQCIYAIPYLSEYRYIYLSTYELSVHLSMCIYNSTLNYTISNNINVYLGWTSLHRAAYNGHTEIVKILLANEANASNKDNDGKKDDNTYTIHTYTYNSYH